MQHSRIFAVLAIAAPCVPAPGFHVGMCPWRWTPVWVWVWVWMVRVPPMAPRRLLLESWHCSAPMGGYVCVTDRAGVHAAV